MKSITASTLLTFALMAGTAVAAPPANDDFANAAALTGNSGSTSGTSVDATDEVDEPTPIGGDGSASVWWTWTPSASGSYTFDTLGSGFDTVLSVYTGTSLASLVLIVEADEGTPDGGPSKVNLSASAGTTYRIAVTGYFGDVGSITLNWAPRPVVVGPISIYKESGSSAQATQGVEESAPPAAYGYKSTSKWTSYQIYDHANHRSTYVSYYTTKETDPDTGRLVTKKYYQSGGLDYADDNFSYDVIPGRLAGSFYWLAASGAGWSYSDPQETGEGYVSGYGSLSQGTAAKVVLSPSLSIYVPRVLVGESLSANHVLATGYYDDELAEWVPYDNPSRELSQSADKWTDTLDLNLTKAANLNDLIFAGETFAKGTLENGLAQVIKLLQAQGYEEEQGYGYYY